MGAIIEVHVKIFFDYRVEFHSVSAPKHSCHRLHTDPHYMTVHIGYTNDESMNTRISFSLRQHFINTAFKTRVAYLKRTKIYRVEI